MFAALGEDAWLLALLAGIFGLLIGSFLNVVVYRLPRIMRRQWAFDAGQILGEDDIRRELALKAGAASQLDAGLRIVTDALAAQTALGLARPRSRCSACGHSLSALENVPLVSWLALRGRCRACQTSISVRYPLVEAAVALLFAFSAYRFGATAQLLASMLIVGLCVAMTLIDADTMLLPDSLTQSLLWAGILFSATAHGFVSLQSSVYGAIAGYLAFWTIGTGFRVLRGIDGMGAGDYKLLAALGAWFGWQALLPIVLLSAGVGASVGLTLMALGRATTLTRLPFGVYLAPAGIITLFWGPQLISWILPGVT